MGSSDESMDIVRDVLKEKFEHGLVKAIKSENKQGKIENGILALSAFRAFIILPVKSGKHGIDHDFNYLEINGIESDKDRKLRFLLENGKIVNVSTSSLEDTDCLIEYVTTSLLKVFPQTPISKLIASFKLEPNKREMDLMNKLENLPQADVGPCGGFSRMYGCMCDYLKLVHMPEVAWDIDTIYLSQNCRNLCLNDFDHLNQRDLAPIIAALEYNTFFNQLSASSLKIKLLQRPDDETTDFDLKNADVLTRTIVQVMKKSAIDKLVLVDCNLKQEFAHGLNTALLANTKCCLTHLDLSNNAIEDRGIQAMSDRLAKLPDGLAVLKLAKTNITSRGISFMFKTFRENERMASILKVLDISHANLKDGDLTDLKQFLAYPNALVTLDLSFTGLALDEIFMSLSRGCLQKLSHLNLAGNTFTAKKVKPVPIPQTIKNFFSSAMELKVIGLSSNKIPPEVVKEILLAIGINKNIVDVELDLSSNELKAAGSVMLESVIAGVCNVKSLNISDNDINEGLVTFLDWTSANRTLKILNISKNLSRARSVDKVMDAIVKLIQEEDSSLENLSIADCNLNYETIVVINALGSNTSLTSIDLSGNNMRDLGAKMLAKALMINSKLTYVNCDRNNITSDGYREIANALERNYTIKNFPMPVHDVHNTRQDASKLETPLYRIQQLLQRNHSSRKFVDEQAFRLQQGFLYTTAHQLVDKMVVQIQDKSEELESQDSDVIKLIVEEGEKYIKDADNSKQLLARMHEVALKSSLQAVEEKLKSLALEVQETVQEKLKETLGSMLVCAEDECETVMGKSDIKSELLQAVDERSALPERFMQDVLDQAASDISNKISEVHLAMAAQISDTVVGDILANLEDCYKNLSDHAENVPTLTKSPKSRGSTISGGNFMDDEDFVVTPQPKESGDQPPVPASVTRVKEEKPARRTTKRSIRPKSQFILEDTTDMPGVEPYPVPEPVELPSVEQSIIVSPKPVVSRIKPKNDIGTGGEIAPLSSLTKSRPKKPRHTRPTRPTVHPPEASQTESKDSFTIQHVDDFYTPTVVEEPVTQNDTKNKKDSKKEDTSNKKDQKKKSGEAKSKVQSGKPEKKGLFNTIFGKKEKRDKSPNPSMSPSKEKTPKKKEDSKDKKARASEEKKKRKGSKDVQPAPVEEKPAPPPAEDKPPTTPPVIQPASPPAEEKPTPPPEEKVERKPLKPPAGAMGFGSILGQADLNKHLSKRKSNSSLLSAKEDEPDKATKAEEDKPKVDKIKEEGVEKPLEVEKQDKNVENNKFDKDVFKELKKESDQLELKEEIEEVTNLKVEDTTEKPADNTVVVDDTERDEMANSEEKETIDHDVEKKSEENSIQEVSVEKQGGIEEEMLTNKENNKIESKQDNETIEEVEIRDTVDTNVEKEATATPSVDKLNESEKEIPQSITELSAPSTDMDTHTSSQEPAVISNQEIDNKDNIETTLNEEINSQKQVDTNKETEVKEEGKELEKKVDECSKEIKESGEFNRKGDTTKVLTEPKSDEKIADVNGTTVERISTEEKAALDVEKKPVSPKPVSPKPLSPKPLSPNGNNQRKSLQLDVDSESSQNNELSPTRLKSPGKPTPTPRPTPRPKSASTESRVPPPITKPRPASVIKPKPTPSTRPKPTKKPTSILHSVNESGNVETNGTSNGDVTSPETSTKPPVKARPRSIESSPSKTSPEVGDTSPES